MRTTGSLEFVTVEKLFEDWAEYEGQKIQPLRDPEIHAHIAPPIRLQDKRTVRSHLLPRAYSWDTAGCRMAAARHHSRQAGSAVLESPERSQQLHRREDPLDHVPDALHAVHQDWLSSILVLNTKPELIRGNEVRPQALKTGDITAASEAAKARENELNCRNVLMIGAGRGWCWASRS